MGALKQIVYFLFLLILVLPVQDMPYLCKKCRSKPRKSEKKKKKKKKDQAYTKKHMHIMTMTKTHAKFQKDPTTTVAGVASTRYLLSEGEITELQKAQYYVPSLFFEKELIMLPSYMLKSKSSQKLPANCPMGCAKRKSVFKHAK